MNECSLLVNFLDASWQDCAVLTLTSVHMFIAYRESISRVVNL